MITRKPITKPAGQEAGELNYDDEGTETSATAERMTSNPGTRPTPVAGAPRVFANPSEAYNSIHGGGSASDLAPGKYEAVVINAALEEPSDRGQSIRLNFALADETLSEHDTLPSWFKLFNPDQSPNTGGIRAWKDTIARLGYGDVPFDELPTLLETIVDDKPGVIINAKYREWQGRKLLNIFVEGLCDNDVVTRFKDQNAF